jgi:hypothetical protein
LTESLGLIEFNFKSDDVQAWTSLYNAIKNKQEIVWPKLPPLCYFPYSNDPLVEKELHDGYEPKLTESLGLIEFNFKSDDVQAWTSLYNAIKNKQEIVWPKLPPLCYFPYSNDPYNPTKFNDTSQTFKKENEDVYKKFNIFKTQYNDWVKNQTGRKQWIQNELGLRIWFHARAWLAFRKAIQSNVFTEDKAKEAYKKANRIINLNETYLVLGSTMSLPLEDVSRPSYFVSF